MRRRRRKGRRRGGGGGGIRGGDEEKKEEEGEEMRRGKDLGGVLESSAADAVRLVVGPYFQPKVGTARGNRKGNF